MRKRTRTPIRLQSHPSECGATCLGILLEHQGVSLASTDLRKRCAVSRDGATVAHIQRGALSLGIECRVSKKGIESLRRAQVPLILHWNTTHFVVLEKIAAGSVWINDPAVGRRRLTMSAFNRQFTGICLEVSGDFLGLAKSQQVAGPAPELESTVFVWAGLVPGLLVFASEFFLGGINRAFFDYVVEFQMTQWGYVLALSGLLLVVLRFFIQYLKDQQARRAELNLATRLRVQFSRRLLERPLSFLESHYAGELQGRLHDAERYVLFRGRAFGALGEQLVVALVCLLLLGLLSPLIALVNLLPFCLLLGWSLLLRERLKELSIWGQQEQGRTQTYLAQRMLSFQRFFAMGVQQHLLATCLPMLIRGQAARVAKTRFLLPYTVAEQLTKTIVPVLTLFFGALLLVRQELSYGTFMLASVLASILMSKLHQIAQALQQYLELRPVIQRAGEAFSGHEEEDETANGTSVIAPSKVTSGKLVEARDLGFGYNGIDCDLFAGVNLSIDVGEVVALVGDSGSGKTTLMELLSGQRAPTAGQVTYATQLVTCPLPCGFVFADDEFIAGTLTGFICASDLPNKDRLEHVLQLVELWDRLGFFVHGNKTAELQSQELSRGEMQRLMLAQALYHGNNCLFFDEAFSHLSLEQSQRIVERLRESGTTVILASHRPEILALCDRHLRLAKW